MKNTNGKKNISARKAHKIMVGVNRRVVSDYLRGSLYELRESTWMAIVRGKNKFYKGKMTRENLDLMEDMGFNLMDIIDRRVQKDCTN